MKIINEFWIKRDWWRELYQSPCYLLRFECFEWKTNVDNSTLHNLKIFGAAIVFHD